MTYSIRLVFTAADTAGSWAIRAATRRKHLKPDTGFSHVGVVVGDSFDLVIDSTMGHGVRLRPLSSLLHGSTRAYFTALQVPREPAEGWLFDQIGKGYDYSALWAFVAPEWVAARRNWQKRDQWFCAEMAAAYALANGAKLPELPGFVSPNDLAIMARPL